MKRSANDWGSRGNAPAGIQSLTRSFSMYITYGHFHNQWYTFEIPNFLTYKINIEVLDSNLPTWSNTSQVMLPWVA